MPYTFLASLLDSKAAAWSAAASGIAAFPFFCAAENLPEKITWGGALVVAAGLGGRLFSKYFDSRPKIIEANTAQAREAAHTLEEQNAAFVQRMVEAHARECAAYERQIKRLESDVDYNRTRAEKCEAQADTSDQISASASKSKHDVLAALQSAETWITNVREDLKKLNIAEPYPYTFSDWKSFFEKHDAAAEKLLSERHALA